MSQPGKVVGWQLTAYTQDLVQDALRMALGTRDVGKPGIAAREDRVVFGLAIATVLRLLAFDGDFLI